MNKNYLIYDKITLNQSYESLLTMTVSYSHAHVYFCTLPSSNLFSFVSCDTIDDEDHILWPKWKHISPSAEHNYATAIKSNGEVNGMLYLTAVLHDPPFKNLHVHQTAHLSSAFIWMRGIQLLIEFSGWASFTDLHFQRLTAQF